jgi:IclR family acetate operon transcriptional repressor
MSGEPTRTQGVQSVDRALDVLETLSAGQGALGVTEIARRVGLPQGTTHRLLLALTARGYVRRESDRRYAVGLSAMRLGDAAYRELGAIAREHLVALVALAGETANLAVLEGEAMMYVAQSPSPHTLRIFAEVGRRVPVHSTAVGKATLAAMPPGEAARLIDVLDLVGSTPRTASTRDLLLAAVERVREDGYAIDDEEQELGVRCVAVALPAISGLRVAVSVSGPSERFSRSRAREVGARMPQVIAGLADAYGAPPGPPAAG